MREKLYQKLHGLPGVPQTKGNDGGDGTQGNNIYFGNISDFFESVEMDVDSFVRYAQKTNKTGPYYTGVFTDNGSDQVDISPNDYINGSIDGVDCSTLDVNPDANKFQYIYNIENYKGIYNYTQESDPDSEYEGMNMSYMKIDVRNNAPLDKNTPIPWMRVDKHFIDATNGVTILDASIEDIYRERTQLYPYQNYKDISTGYDFMPGNNNVGKINGFELFKISDNDNDYTYSTDNERYESTQYGTFDEYGRNYSQLYKFSNIDDVNLSLAQLIQLFKEGSNYDRSPVNYVKYYPKVIQKVSFTDKLKSNIKAGDVIYFYTDPNSFEYDPVVQYMVVITKELEQCELQDLIDHATITEPFTFKYIDESNIKNQNYVTTTNKVTAVYYAGTDEQPKYGKNFSNFITYGSDSILNLGSFNAVSSQSHSNMILRTDNNEFIIGYSDSQNQFTLRDIDSNALSTNYLPLKIRNLKVKRHNIGNIETAGCFIPKHVKLFSDYCYTLTAENFNSNKNMFYLSPDDIVDDTSFTDYTINVTHIIYDKSKATDGTFYNESGYSIIKKYVFVPDTDYWYINLTEEYGDNTVHMIMLSVSESNDIAHFSKHTIATYDTETKNYDVTVLEDENEMEIPDEDYDTNILFTPHGISSDKIDNSHIDILIPYNVLNEEEILPTNIHIYFNSTEISSTTSYQNSWFGTDGFTTEDNRVVQNNKHYWKIGVKFNMSDNIPQILSGTNISTANDYMKNGGVDSESDGCELFNAILEGKSTVTKQRSVLVTVKYNIGTKEHKGYYKLVQPGFAESRKIPVVNMSIDKQLNQLEKANNIENGVLCNQVQFFVNVDISDFDENVWGSIASDNDVTLNFDIKNCKTDYDFIEKYSIESATETYTLHSYNDIENDDFAEDTSTGQPHSINYCSIKTYLVDNDITDPYNMSQNELDESHISLIRNTFETDTDHSDTEDNCVLSNAEPNPPAISIESEDGLVLEKKYMTQLQGMFDTPYTRDSGLRDNITIKFRNITFEKAKKGRFRFRVVTEIANPVLSRLFFRFYVSNMWISYGEQKLHVGTSNLASIKQTGRLTTYEYMYATETLNMFLCPVSMTVIPADYQPEEKRSGSGEVKITGSDEQIMIKLDKYVPEIEQIDESEKMQRYASNIIPWNEFSLKKRYFQDNVKNISVQPVHIYELKDKISRLECLFHRETKLSKFDSVVTDKSYMTVLFNALYYNCRMRDDVASFYYNDELYNANQYDQYAKNKPLFIGQSFDVNVRDTMLIKSIDTWNHLYKASGLTNKFLVLGNTSMYGNGYEYLPDSYDKGQFTEKEAYSLAKTQELNDEMMFDKPVVEYAYQLENGSDNNPEFGKYFRKLLYQIGWKYPRHYKDDNSKEFIEAFDIVNPIDYITNSSSEKKYPHNLAYSIIPRCAYNDEDDTAIVFMLRTPSVKTEKTYKMSAEDFYFDTNGDYQSTLKNSDTVEPITD